MYDDIEKIINYNLSVISRLRQEVDPDQLKVAEQLYNERVEYYTVQEEKELGVMLREMIKWGGPDFNISSYFHAYQKIIYHSVKDTLTKYGNGSL